MSKQGVFLILAIGLFLSGCQKIAERTSADDGVGTSNLATWNDPNFEIITVGSYNYTTYGIGSIFLMPTDKNDIKYAGETTGSNGTPLGASNWSASSGSGPALAWDLRWKAPHKFKIWWYVIVDPKLFRNSSGYPKGGGMYDPYDPYITKQTRPGSAWCEGEVEIKETYNEFYGPPYPYRTRNKLYLYFYPNGTVQGHLEYGIDSEIQIADITKRDEFPILKGRACIKEIPNPFYGKKRPISIH